MELILVQSKFDKCARFEFACQFACQFACPEPAAVWFQIKAFFRPNLRAKLVLQDYGFLGAAWIFHLKKIYLQLQNLTPQKFDSAAMSSSRYRARRRDSIGKANLKSPQY